MGANPSQGSNPILRPNLRPVAEPSLDAEPRWVLSPVQVISPAQLSLGAEPIPGLSPAKPRLEENCCALLCPSLWGR